MENTSGEGKAAVIPAEVARWNWGAFLLNWIWGIGNNTLIALLVFVPFVNIVMPFVLGAKGSTWAWQNKRWHSVEQFRRVQRKWAIWSVVAYVIIFSLVAALFFSIMTLMKGSQAYQIGYDKLIHNQEAVAILGTPVKTGLPMGNINVSGPTGKADISFSAEGPKAKGTVYVDAAKDMGTWKINRIELQIDGRQGRIDLNQ